MSQSSEEDMETCGNCGEESGSIEFCYGCRCDYCDNCSFQGGCGVCDAEEFALEQFETAIRDIESMNPPEASAKQSLEHLVEYMRYFHNAVECGEDKILCMNFDNGGLHSASDIMTDCGDGVIDEMNWCRERAQDICEGKNEFTVDIP